MDSLEYFVSEDGKFSDDSEFMAYSLDPGAGLDTGAVAADAPPRPALRIRTHSTSSSSYSSASTSYSSSSAVSTSYSSSWSTPPFSGRMQMADADFFPIAEDQGDDAFLQARRALCSARARMITPSWARAQAPMMIWCEGCELGRAGDAPGVAERRSRRWQWA
ncbi:hypothetical protein C8R44DRAFT_753651 [Mycena epipterygia]|nr:hypothetical protein C8R44DRAFT_753651 [Mycena epipterygia]